MVLNRAIAIVVLGCTRRVVIFPGSCTSGSSKDNGVGFPRVCSYNIGTAKA